MRIKNSMIVFVLTAVAFVSGCSSEKKPQTLEEAFLSSPEVNTVKFTVSGTASCNVCLENKLSIMGLQVEIEPEGDPMHSIGTYSFKGLGPFTIPDMRAETGKTVEVLGTLFIEGKLEPSTISGYATVAVPDNDGETATVMLDFPSQ